VRTRAGVTLLETLVALVILGLVVTASFQLYATALRSAADAREWSTATAYAQEGMELAKLDLAGMLAREEEELEGGFRRQVEVWPAGGALSQVTVTVVFPDGGRFQVRRLMAAGP
jgi:prepilin-type N-terminal cleavage/methylation domain-containing protein